MGSRITSALHSLFLADVAAPICCHSGALWFVMAMTERDMGM